MIVLACSSEFLPNPNLKSLHKIGELRQRDAIMSPEAQVHHNGKGHEIRHPGSLGPRNEESIQLEQAGGTRYVRCVLVID